MLSSTWQVTGASGTPAELIKRTPLQRDFEATSVPGVLEMDGAWVRREEEARRLDEEGGPDRVRASILRREFILDAPLKDAAERGWTMTLTFGGFTGPLYAWVDGTFVGFCADGFIPTAFDVTDALQPTHTHAIAVLLMDSPACCHGLFREVSLEARPPAHLIDVIPQASHDGTSGSVLLRVECSEASNTSTIRAALLGEGQQQEIWSASAPAGEDLEASGVGVLPWSAEEPVLYTLVVTLSDEEAGTQDTIALQVGFRDLTATPEGLRLGGRPLTLRGVRRNECDGRTGLAVGLQDMLDDIVWCKRHGVNAVAIEQGPAHARFYELADLYGLYIIGRGVDDVRARSRARRGDRGDDPPGSRAPERDRVERGRGGRGDPHRPRAGSDAPGIRGHGLPAAERGARRGVALRAGDGGALVFGGDGSQSHDLHADVRPGVPVPRRRRRPRHVGVPGVPRRRTRGDGVSPGGVASLGHARGVGAPVVRDGLGAGWV